MRWGKLAPARCVAAKIAPYFVVVLALESPKSSSSVSSGAIFARNATCEKVNNGLWSQYDGLFLRVVRFLRLFSVACHRQGAQSNVDSQDFLVPELCICSSRPPGTSA